MLFIEMKGLKSDSDSSLAFYLWTDFDGAIFYLLQHNQ